MVNNFNFRNVINAGENDDLEYKESFRWDYFHGQRNNNISQRTTEAVAEMLNTKGGDVVIGVRDDPFEIIGVQADINSYRQRTPNITLRKAKELFLIDIGKKLKENISIKVTNYVHTQFVEIRGIEIVDIKVEPSKFPMFHGEEKEFLVRLTSARATIIPSATCEYFKDRFNYKGRKRYFEYYLEVLKGNRMISSLEYARTKKERYYPFIGVCIIDIIIFFIGLFTNNFILMSSASLSFIIFALFKATLSFDINHLKKGNSEKLISKPDFKTMIFITLFLLIIGISILYPFIIRDIFVIMFIFRLIIANIIVYLFLYFCIKRLENQKDDEFNS